MKNSLLHLSKLNILRCAAVIGVISALIYNVISVQEIRPNQSYSFYALLLIVLGAGISLYVLRKTFITVLRNYDLLVPIGLYIPVQTLLSLFAENSAYITFNNDRFNLSGLTASIVLITVLQVALSICFTGWMTRIILRFVQTEKVELFNSFSNIKWWFPRTFGVFILGWLPLYLLLFIFLPLSLVSGNLGPSAALLLPATAFIGVFTLLWNLAISAVLPTVLWSTINLKQAIFEGIIVSWKNKAKIFIPVVLLMLVCGWITVISVTYSSPKVEEKFGDFAHYTSNLRSRSNLATNFVLTSFYPETSDWNKNMLKAVEETPLSSVDFRIKIILLFLSLVVSLRIIETIFGSGLTDIDNILRLNKYALSNNRNVIPVLAAVAILFPFELIRPVKLENLFKVSDASKFENKKIYTGKDFLSKNEFFTIGQHDSFELNPVNNESFQLGSITDIFVSGDNSNVVITGSHGAILLDKFGTLINRIKFDFNKSEVVSVDTNSKTTTTMNYSGNAKVIDLENDGTYEFAGTAGNGNSVKGFILDSKGKIIHEFDDGKERFSIQNVNAKDVDGDGEKEIIVEYSNELRFYDLEGNEKWSQKSSADSLSNSSEFADIDGDGKDEILHANYLSGSIRKLKSDSVEKIKRPYNQHGFLIKGIEKPSIVFFEQNNLGLFDFEGNLLKRYEAPLSEIEKKGFYKIEKVHGLSKFVQPFRANAVKVKLKPGEAEYLAVLLTLSTETENYFVDMLYLYDGNGKLVYQETTGGDDRRMEIIPLENETEGLLIQEKDKVWLYKAN